MATRFTCSANPLSHRTAGLGVSGLTLEALLAATAPLQLHLNAWTDGDGPEPIEYGYQGNGIFKAGSRYPAVDLNRFNGPAFVDQFEPGEMYRFSLYRGELGFYQLDSDPLFKDTRAYYLERAEGN